VSVVTFEVGDFSATGDYGLFRQQLFCISSRQLKSRRVSRQQYITQIMKEWKTFSFAHKLARSADYVFLWCAFLSTTPARTHTAE
jgi:ribosomal protein L16/L10AE